MLSPNRQKQVDFLIQAAYWSFWLLIFWLSCRYFFPWTAPFLFALLFSTLIEPLICWCQARLGFKRGFSSAVFTVLFLLLFCGLLFVLISQLLTEAYQFLQQIPTVIDAVSTALERLQETLRRLTESFPLSARQWLQQVTGRISSAELPLFSDLTAALLSAARNVAAALPSIGLFCITTVLAIFFISCSYPAVLRFIKRQLPAAWQKKTSGLRSSLSATLLRWLKAQSILFLVTFCLLLAGLFLLREPYALLLAFLITLVDALPVFGTGTVLVPWGAVELLLGRPGKAAALLLLFLLTLLTRNILEPKLIAAQAALPPVATLLAMYVGFSAFGLGGMILFPILLLFLKQLHDGGQIRLWK